MTVDEVLATVRAFKHRQWREWVADLRSAHPPPLPVRVVRRPMKARFGLCSNQGTHFLISVDSHLPNQIAWMILLHEWAHALTWDSEPADVDHNDAWGAAYAMLWRDNHGDEDYTHPDD